MTRKELDDFMKAHDGFQITFKHDIRDNGKTEEEIIMNLEEAIEAILFRATKDSEVDSEWLMANCIIALHERGIVHCGYETNTGKSAWLDISEMYEELMTFDDEDS